MNNDEKKIFTLTTDITYEDILLSYDNEFKNLNDRLLQDINLEDNAINYHNGYDAFEYLNIVEEASRQKMKTGVMKKIKTPFRKNKWVKAILAASIVLFVITTLISPFGQKTLAEIIGIIYFIPGSGKAAEDNLQDVYVLSKPIDMECDGGIVTIQTITKSDEGVAVYATSNDALGLNSMSILIKGKEYKTYITCTGSNCGQYFFNVPSSTTEFTLTLNEKYSTPVSLRKANTFNDYTDMGPTSIKNNFGLTLIPIQLNNKIQFEFVQHNTNLGLVDLYGTCNKEGHDNLKVSIKDDNEQSYAVKHPDSYMGVLSTFSFTPKSNAHSYTVQIPELTLQYNLHDEKITLPMPKEGETIVDKRVDLQGYPVDITKIVRKNNLVTISMNTHYNVDRPENICHFMVNMGKMKTDYFSSQLNDQLTTESIDFYIDPDDKNLTIYFEKLYTILKGPWTFTISNPKK